jgi:RNA polymerase sigma-70 factor, ECF subfamily
MGEQREAREPVPGDVTDEVLLQRCAAGDATAFRQLFDRYEPLLARFFAQALGSREDAEEAVVDTFLKLWRRASSYRGEGTVRTWLYRIAQHTTIDALRRRRRQPVVDAAIPGLDERDVRLAEAPHAVNPEAAMVAGYQKDRDQQALRLALAQLPPAERTVVVLHYFESRSYVQIAEITGASVPSVRMRLHRARQRLKAHLIRLRDSDEDLGMLADPPVDPTLDPRRMLAL